MDIGKMREYVTIQSATRTSDGQGGWTSTWATLTQQWARVEVLSQSRTLDQSGVKYSTAVKFTMRIGDYNVTTEHQIVWGDTYTIHSVVRDEKNNFIIVTAYK